MTRNRSPIHLVVSAALWAISILLSLASVIWYWAASTHPFFSLLFGPILGAGLLWLYWNGFSGVRYFLILTSVLYAIDALYALTGLHMFSYLGAEAEGAKLLNILRLGISLYIVAWLLTSEASKYFTTEARHERKSMRKARQK
jgi:hypothetical protein